MRRCFFLAAMLVAIAAGLKPAAGKDFNIVDVAPGATVDVYFEINLGGEVYLNIRDRNGPSCTNLWWIIWPLGTITDLGERCGSMRLDIPGIGRFSIASKLRARGGGVPIKIGVAATEQVANSISFSFP